MKRDGNDAHPWRAQTRLDSFRYALDGMVYALKTQPNLRIHMVATIGCVLLAVLFRFSVLEWALLVFSMGAVVGAELLNTAIESAVNLGSPGEHPTAKIAKDVAAAAVLISVIVSVCVGLMLFVPHFWRKIHVDWCLF